VTLIWREQLSVANDAIDNDHKHLIEIVNQVERTLTTRDRSELARALDSLTQYSHVHFDREERIAAAAGYIRTPGLHQSHVALLERFVLVRTEFEASGPQWSAAATDHFIEFLRNWLIDHVIKEDLLMKPTLQKLSPSFSPG